MNRLQEMVREFHEKFGVDVETEPTLPNEKIRALRAALINEEAKEFSDAAKAGDLVEMADALADIAYVVFGAALSCGIDIEKVFEEVHRSNVTKVWPDGSVRRREDGKVLKPPTYSPPDIPKVLDELAVDL